MRKRIIAVVALGLPLAALAQSSATLYGILDVTPEYLHFSSTGTHPSSNLKVLSSDTSRIGFRGSEDLGSGQRAYFKLEHGLQVDTGTQTSATAFWNRESYVGLGDTQLGGLQLGSQFAPALWMALKVDPFYRFNIGGQYTLLQGLRGYQNRYDNAIQYVSASYAGVSGRLIAAAGEGSATGKSISANLEYSNGPLYLGTVYDFVKTTAASVALKGAPPVSRTFSAGAVYDFNLVKVHGWYQTNRIENLSNVNGYMAGLTVPIGAGEIRASYAHRNATNANASLAAAGYFYIMSKRTTLYGVVGRLNNSGTAAFRMGPATAEQANLGLPFAGQDISGAQVGIRHFF